jgi:ATP-binding protein involved in chromosome partitioning
MHVPLLGQIPLVQSICESGDAGKPVALDEHTLTGQAFAALASDLVEQVAKRNAGMAPTEIVRMER